ncbi:uncharacterized protein VP01_1220g2 [Puccinia sorghi]|uniref:Uncharacterized protein n=1 Tax=Puccinia sorghi TaxID=27349 RepID=A0A0L6VQ24_9BASI|nr:uncharacterized protein VP01_1220g2 [Puccinia sorghi]
MFFSWFSLKFTQSANAIFPSFQSLPVSQIPTSKQNISFLLNNLLGQEPTDEMAEAQQKAIDTISPSAVLTLKRGATLLKGNLLSWKSSVYGKLRTLEKGHCWDHNHWTKSLASKSPNKHRISSSNNTYSLPKLSTPTTATLYTRTHRFLTSLSSHPTLLPLIPPNFVWF